MNFLVKVTNLELTPAISLYIEKVFNSLEKLIVSLGEANVETRIEVGRSSYHHKKGDIFFAEVNLVCGKKLIRNRVENSNLYAAIDEVKDNLRRELTKFKGRQESLFKRGSRTASKMWRLSPLARFWRKGRIRDDDL